MSKHFDLAVIGGGPGGYSTAISAGKAKLSVVLFEKADVGGTCLNVGCIPTKFLLDKANAIAKIRKLSALEILKDTGAFSFKRIQKEKNQVVKKLTNGVSWLLKNAGVTVVHGEASLTSGKEILCNNESFTADNIIIATGSHPAKPPIPGIEYTIDSTAMLDLEKLPRRLIVIGGGVIGMEMASAFRAFGSEVTVIEVMDKLFANEEPQAVSLLLESLKKTGIKINTGAKINRIVKNAASLTVKCDDADYEADVILAATGRKPSFDGINLDLDKTERGFIKTNAFMETSKKNVYAIGDIAGGYQLAHAAYSEGEIALSHILKRDCKANSLFTPRCIYTLPCFAAVGLTSVQAEKQNIKVAVGSFNYEANGMALAEGATGRVFVVMDKDKKTTLGVHIVGENSSELIAMGEIAVRKKLTLTDWQDMIVAHPSLAEMVKEAALDAFGLAVHK